MTTPTTDFTKDPVVAVTDERDYQTTMAWNHADSPTWAAESLILTHLGNQLLTAWATSTDNTESSNIVRKIMGVAARACVNLAKMEPSKFFSKDTDEYATGPHSALDTYESYIQRIYVTTSGATTSPFNFVIADCLWACSRFVCEYGVPLRARFAAPPQAV